MKPTLESVLHLFPIRCHPSCLPTFLTWLLAVPPPGCALICDPSPIAAPTMKHPRWCVPSLPTLTVAPTLPFWTPKLFAQGSSSSFSTCSRTLQRKGSIVHSFPACPFGLQSLMQVKAITSRYWSRLGPSKRTADLNLLFFSFVFIVALYCKYNHIYMCLRFLLNTFLKKKLFF